MEIDTKASSLKIKFMVKVSGMTPKPKQKDKVNGLKEKELLGFLNQRNSELNLQSHNMEQSRHNFIEEVNGKT